MSAKGIKWNKETKYGILTVLAILLISFVFALQSPVNIFSNGVRNCDQSVFEYIARCIINKGMMPYKDTFDHKGPLIYIIYVVGMLINERVGLWFIDLINIFITFVLLYKISHLVCGRRLLSIGILLAVSAQLFPFYLGGGMVETYALPFISGSIYIFLDYFLNKRISNIRLILCGLSFGAVCLLRVNMIGVWMVMCVAVLVVSIMEKDSKSLIKFIALFLAGAAIISVPIFIWLVANDSFRVFIKSYWDFNIWYSTEDNAVMADKVSTFNWFLNNGIILISIGMIIIKTVCKRTKADIISLVLLIVNMCLVAMSGNAYEHYGQIIIPTLVFPFASFIDWMIKEKKEQAVCYALCGYIAISYVCSPWIHAVTEVFKEYETREEFVAPNIDKNIAAEISSRVKEGDKILVCGNWDALYNITGTYSASRYSYQNWPCKQEERLEEFKKEISKKPPKIIVVEDGCTVYDAIMEIIENNNYKDVYSEKGLNSRDVNKTHHVYVKKKNK